MPDIIISARELDTMIKACKDMQHRIPAHGMPELDMPFHLMISKMEERLAAAFIPEPTPYEEKGKQHLEHATKHAEATVKELVAEKKDRHDEHVKPRRR